MNLLLFPLFFYFGTIIAKYFFYYINKSDFYYYFKNSFDKDLKKYMLIPIAQFSFFSLKPEVLKNKKFIKLKKLSILCEIFGGIIFGIFSFSILNTLASLGSISALICIGILVTFTGALLYLAIYDIITFSIPERFVKILSFFAVLTNLIIGVIKIVSADLGQPILTHIPLGNMGNLLAGVAFALLIWLIVKISKEKGMGEGDVYLVLIIGLLLGWPNTLVSFLSTLILGSLISIIFAIYLKRFKDVIVPFVPLLLLGFVVALSFGSELYSKLFFI